MQVYTVERMGAARTLASALARGYDNLHVIPSLKVIAAADGACVDIVVAEPFFFQMQSLVLWQCLNVWYTLGALRRSRLVTDATIIVPRRASIVAGELRLPQALGREVCGISRARDAHARPCGVWCVLHARP